MGALATFRSFVGVGLETTPGTAVAATDYIPIASDPKFSDKLNLIPDKSWRGSSVMVYDEIAGSKSGSGTLAGNLNLSAIGYILQSLLPDHTTTGASAPYTHTFAAKNTTDGQPSSYTFTDYDGDQARQFAGSKCDSLNIKFDPAGLVTYTSKWNCFPSVTGSVPTPSYSAVPAIAAYTGVVKIGGTQILNLISGEIDIKRKTENIQTVNGTQSPYQIFSGAIEASMKLKAVLLASDPMLSTYLANSVFVPDIKFTAGTSSLEFTSSKAVYTKADVDRGKEYVAIDAEATFIGNTTDAGATGGYSPLKVTLVNTVASGVYN